MASCWSCLGNTLLFLPYLQQQHWRVLLWTQGHVEDSSKDVPLVFLSGPSGCSFLLQQGKLLEAVGKLNVLRSGCNQRVHESGDFIPKGPNSNHFSFMNSMGLA